MTFALFLTETVKSTVSVSKHRTIMNCVSKGANISKDVFVAPAVMGDVFVAPALAGVLLFGHGAVLHACTVRGDAFVGMGAILLDGAVVEKMLWLVQDLLSDRAPAFLLVWAGNPAKFLRKLTEEEITSIKESALIYTNLAQVHTTENTKTFDEIELEKLLSKKFDNRDEECDSMINVVRELPPELIAA